MEISNERIVSDKNVIITIFDKAYAFVLTITFVLENKYSLQNTKLFFKQKTSDINVKNIIMKVKIIQILSKFLNKEKSINKGDYLQANKDALEYEFTN